MKDEQIVEVYNSLGDGPSQIEEVTARYTRLKNLRPGRYTYTDSTGALVAEFTIDIQKGEFVVNSYELKIPEYPYPAFSDGPSFADTVNERIAIGDGLKGVFIPVTTTPKTTTAAPLPAEDTSLPAQEEPKEQVIKKLQKFKNLGTPTSTGAEDATYRVSATGRYVPENIQKAKEWLESVLPQVPFRDVVGLIDGIAWGKFTKNGIILSNLAEEGTIYHEAFEAVKALFITDRESYTINAKFRARKGSFIDRETGLSVPYARATEDQIREELAEEFREFGLTGKRWDGEMEKMNLFERIWNMIKNFLFGADIDIQEVFDRITEGYYKDKFPIPSNKSAYRIADKEDGLFLYMVNQSVTAELFSELYRSGSNISAVFTNDKANLANVYDRVFAKLTGNFALPDQFLELLDKHEGSFQKAIIEADEKDIPFSNYLTEVLSTKDFTLSLVKEIEDAYDGITYIAENWEDIKQKNIEHLKTTYKINVSRIENTINLPLAVDEENIDPISESFPVIYRLRQT